MFKGKKIIALIPARGGSKGVPGKNIRNLGGKPLLAWTIKAALAAKTIDRVVLSSDATEIIEVAEKYGCEVLFRRPAELSTDTASTKDVILHALHTIEEKFDYLVLLQPTSPLRTAHDIDSAVHLCDDNERKICVSVTEVEKTPYWMLSLNEEGCAKPLFAKDEIPKRRQDASPFYILNGAIYVIDCALFLEEKDLYAPGAAVWIMPKSRSIDVDTEEDFQIL